MLKFSNSTKRCGCEAHWAMLQCSLGSFGYAGTTIVCGCLMQVVLPLLQNEVVTTGWVSLPDFLTGLALVQAMPGPLFNFAAYLGGHASSAINTVTLLLQWHSFCCAGP